MTKWHWIVRERANFNKEYEAFKKGWTEKPETRVLSEGYVEGTRQDAIDRAKFDIGWSGLVIEVKRVK